MTASVVWFGVIAAALVLMAFAQVLMAFALIRALRRVVDTVEQLQRDVRPLVERATRVADDASRVTALVVVQAERIDALVRSTATRVDETFSLVQKAVVEPLQHGSAILAGVRAALAAVRAWQRPPSAVAGVREDEDPLFVG